jgi:hypothetical protein
MTTQTEIKKAMDSAMGALGSFTWAMFSIVFMAIMHGYMLQIFWGWFVLPVFTSAPTFSVAQAIGLMLLVRFVVRPGRMHVNQFVHPYNPEKVVLEEKVQRPQLLGMVLMNIAIFLFGWIIKAFI